jgi:putative hydrolase of the HAD superfamily
MFELIGFDADDTLWHSECHFQAAHAEFERILARYIDVGDARIHERLLATERANLKLFGYGAKGMTLSMVEAAIELSSERIAATDLHRIVRLGKSILCHPVELLPGVREAVQRVAETHRVVLITKGDLFHQEAKVRGSGLADVFSRIEIVSEKDRATYARVLGECAVAPRRFAMVGNSLRSDIAPVIELGGWGVYMPYAVTWAHEQDASIGPDHPRVEAIAEARQIPAALARLAEAERAATG